MDSSGCHSFWPKKFQSIHCPEPLELQNFHCTPVASYIEQENVKLGLIYAIATWQELINFEKNHLMISFLLVFKPF